MASCGGILCGTVRPAARAMEVTPSHVDGYGSMGGWMRRDHPGPRECHARRYLVVLSHLAADLLSVCLGAPLALARLAPA